ncbi:MAG TPA: hypothetical protein VFY29_05920 [Terriglobia bacterium]|nr:hypothetical protein [Terriglobia bacterium]
MPNKRMADLTSVDKTLFWVNLAYVASIVIMLAAGLFVVFLSWQRSSAAEAETRKRQLEFVQQTAAANERAARANEDAQRAISEAASSAADTQRIRKENMELAISLERERRMRLEMEDRLGRQPAAAASAHTPRMLSLEQEQALVSAMSRFTSAHASLIELNDVEAGPFARDLTRMLRSAGWNVAVSNFGALVPPQHGIVCTHDDGNAAAAALVKTLRSYNLTVYERRGTPDQFEILVGLKPPNDR